MTKYSLKENFLIKENKGIELSGNKLSVYHLTGAKKFKDYSSYVKDTEKPYKPSKPRKVKDRARNIINRVTYDKARRGATTQSQSDIEFQGITELLADPYTVGTGFTPGYGAMYGPGLYTCYDFNPSIVHLYGNICFKFEVDISNYIIFFEDLAKQIHGDKWKVEDQIEKLFDEKFSSLAKDELFAKTKEDLKQYCTSLTQRITGTSYLVDDPSNKHLTSSSAFTFSRYVMGNYTHKYLTSVIDGIIFRGHHDGPVCVVYNPQRKAKVVELGRVVGKEVEWHSNVASFFPDQKLALDVDFETLNDIAQENDVDEEDFKQDQLQKVEGLLPTLYWCNEINKVADSPELTYETIQKVYDLVVNDNLKIESMFINHVLFANTKSKVNKAIGTSGNSLQALKVDQINIENIHLKCLNLITELCKKINYFGDNDVNYYFPRFLDILTSPINKQSVTKKDFEKFVDIYIENAEKVSYGMLVFRNIQYGGHLSVNDMLFSRNSLNKLNSLDNSRLMMNVGLYQISQLARYRSRLDNLTGQDILDVLIKMLTFYFPTKNKDYKTAICKLPWERKYFTELPEIQQFLFEELDTISSARIAGSIDSMTRGVFTLFQNEIISCVRIDLLNKIIDIIFEDIDRLGTKARQSVEQNLLGIRDENIKRQITNQKYHQFVNQKLDTANNWSPLIDELKQSQTPAETRLILKNNRKVETKNKEYAEALVSGIISGDIPPDISNLQMYLRWISYEIKLPFQTLISLCKACFSYIDIKPNSKKHFNDLLMLLLRSSKGVEQYLETIALLKTIPEAHMNSLELGRIHYTEGDNDLFERVANNSSLLTLFFSGMSQRQVLKIAKGIHRSVNYAVTIAPGADLYLPDEGIKIVIDYIEKMFGKGSILKLISDTRLLLLQKQNSQDPQESNETLIKKYISLILS